MTGGGMGSALASSGLASSVLEGAKVVVNGVACGGIGSVERMVGM